jgi:Gene product 88
MRTIQIIDVTKKEATSICGTLTSTSKMPCNSYSLPTEACITGFKLAKIAGSICSVCYANKGFYSLYQNNIKPAQFARLDSINNEYWVSGMIALIGSDEYFRWHDSGDLQSLEHLEKIVTVAKNTPNCKHWLPTREYSIVKQYISKHGRKSIPDNLKIRLSAMYPDKKVIIPTSLQGVANVTVSNVHTSTASLKSNNLGVECGAYKNNGECGDCRLCWSDKPVSYLMH